jgi:hypothetical protein
MRLGPLTLSFHFDFSSAAIIFTLGDSMTVVEHPNRSIHTILDVTDMFAANAVSDFGVSDREGFQPRFIEMQLWDRAYIRGLSKHLAFPLAYRLDLV